MNPVDQVLLGPTVADIIHKLDKITVLVDEFYGAGAVGTSRFQDFSGPTRCLAEIARVLGRPR